MLVVSVMVWALIGRWRGCDVLHYSYLRMHSTAVKRKDPGCRDGIARRISIPREWMFRFGIDLQMGKRKREKDVWTAIGGASICTEVEDFLASITLLDLRPLRLKI